MYPSIKKFSPADPYDHSLREAIAGRLKILHRGGQRFAGVIIEVERGVVTLRGHVRSFYDQQIAKATAHQVEGIHAVRDELELRREGLSTRVTRLASPALTPMHGQGSFAMAF